MATAQNNCQPLVTKIQGVLEPYVAVVTAVAPPGGEKVRLRLTEEQLLLLAALLGEKNAPVALVVDMRLTAVRTATEQLATVSQFLSGNAKWHLIESGLSVQEEAGDVVSGLSQTIHHVLQQSSSRHFVIPAQMLGQLFPAREDYHALELSLHRHESASLSRLIHLLIERGYTRYAAAQEPGSFSVRGEQIDMAAPTGERYTLTLHGATVEQIIQRHTTATGRERQEIIANVVLPPVAFPVPRVPLTDLVAQHAVLRPFDHQTAVPAGIIYDALHTDFPFPLTPLSNAVPRQPLFVVYENYDRVAQYLVDHDLTAASICQSALARVPFALQHEELTLLTERALFRDEPTTAPRSYTAGRALVAELTPHSPAVHSDHGIGIFEGLQTRALDGRPKEYLILRYAAGDMLSVPVEYAHKVTPYLGEKTPIIHRLGGTLWSTTRRKAQHDAEEFARELLLLAGKRGVERAGRYTLYENIQTSLAATFPFELTSDQQTALAALEEDLTEPRLLDRLIVGDVGFGKTELALRAARHVIANGKQVALLAPTTLLVQQHADTAERRFPDLKDSIGVLSRFASAREQAATREKIANGRLKLVIGTHALLSEKTRWHDLGLVIIDEEQRFGVKHKEHFKKIRANVDFLSLSATPIPRTLSMALSGLKDLSVITTPPAGRKEVLTQVTRANDAVIKEALERELARGGQVYIVAPKVRSLPALARQVAKLVPDASLAVAHGQLPAAELARTMRRFDTGEVAVLVTSSIIENGLDLPNANTIIVMSAAHFGLSDLYQLRGRVGRRNRQGYAYFLYNQHELTSLQRQRLTALTEASRLGSGWSLAQRDLEIRGAGNVLGAEQSGTANQVGVQLYLDMVQEAIERQSDTDVRRGEVELKLPLAALIPQHYIANDETRFRYYQQLSRARTPAELMATVRQMAETYGELPTEVTNFILLLQLQHAAAANAISEIAAKQITPPDENPYWRLRVTTKKVPETLQKLQPLGTWTVRNSVLTHDLDDITLAFLQKVLEALAQK